MKPVLYRYRDSESVIKPMEGYTPGEGWEPLYDQAAMDAAVAAERERCANMCEAICDVNWSIYKGYGEHKEHPQRANTYVEGISDGAGQCADAIRKDEA